MVYLQARRGWKAAVKRAQSVEEVRTPAICENLVRGRLAREAEGKRT